MTFTAPSDSSPAIWTAGLVQLQGTHNNNGYAYAGFGDGDWGNSGPINVDTEGLLFGVEGDGTNMDLVFRHRDSAGTMTSRVLQDGISSGDPLARDHEADTECGRRRHSGDLGEPNQSDLRRIHWRTDSDLY